MLGDYSIIAPADTYAFQPIYKHPLNHGKGSPYVA